jgi:hypothetical protein
MTNFEIKDQIDKNNATINSLLDPTQFTLNKEILDLLEKNLELQEMCEHEFEGGICKYCYKGENE